MHAGDARPFPSSNCIRSTQDRGCSFAGILAYFPLHPRHRSTISWLGPVYMDEIHHLAAMVVSVSSIATLWLFAASPFHQLLSLVHWMGSATLRDIQAFSDSVISSQPT